MFEDRDLSSFDTFREIIARLRAPDGCPWDRKQTHSSLRPYLLEECYEVMEALDDGNEKELCRELGDLLLQIMLHSQIAVEHGEFDVGDVIHSINTKLIHRHPHVFGDVEVEDAREVSINWEALKKEERLESEKDASLLDSVPVQMPALAYSQSIQRRVAKVGFDWKDFGGIIEKVAEEVKELEEAEDQQQRDWEFGDLLFVMVNAARWLDIDSESSLRQANQRFYNRFHYMEKTCTERGIALGDLSFDEQNALWDEAKQEVG